MRELLRETTLKIAYQAFEYFAQGWATGDFQPYLDMLTDEFMFWYPYGNQQQKFAGREGKARMIAKCYEHVAAGDHLMFTPPYHIISSDTTVMFEVKCQGVISNQPYHSWTVIALDVSGERISGFREYCGDIGY